MTSEAQKRAVRKYDKAHTKQFLLKLNLQTDADIIDWFADLENVQGYIKELVRRDMKNRG